MNILRLTRHAVTPAQRDALRRIYGDVAIIEVSETVPDVARIAQIVALHAADVLEAVLPLPLMAACLDPRAGLGIPVIRAVMHRALTPAGDAAFTFSHYERLVKVEVVTERL